MTDLRTDSLGSAPADEPQNTGPIASQSALLAGEATAASNHQNQLAPGTVLQNRFEVLRIVGSGGMSTVYLGRDRKFSAVQKFCAIKEMFATIGDPDTRRLTLANFEREANLMAGLEHPAVPKIWDYFVQGHCAYLVIEFIRGKDLEAVMEATNGPLPEADVVSWAVQILEVLSYLHNQKPVPVVFRDLKPANLMLTPEGRIVLIDFGIAKVVQPDKRGTMVGTEGYSPPEQYRGSAESRSDLYSLAATMHQLLTRSDPRYEVPFTFNERPVRKLNPACSAEVEAIIARALEYDINKRFATAEEMRDALLALLPTGTGMLTSPMPGGKTQSTLTGAMPPTAGLNTRPTNGATMVPGDKTQSISTRSIGSPLFGGSKVLGGGQTLSKMPAISQPAQVSAPDTERLLWRFMCEEWVTSSPTLGDGLVFAGCYDYNIYAIDQKTGMFKWKYATDGGIASSPLYLNGTIYIGSEDNHLYAINARTGRPQWAYKTGGPVRSSPRASSSMIFVGSDDQHLHAVDIRFGQTAWKFTTWKQVRSSPCYASGTVYCGSEDDQIYAIDSSLGSKRWGQSLRSPVTSSPLVENNMVYVGSMDYNIYALDANTGWQIWRYRTENYVLSSPTIANGRLYIGSTDGSLYCLDARNGRLIWRFAAGGPITTSTPRVVNGLVVFGCQDRHVYCLEANTGTLRWKYATGGAIPSSAAIADGIAYIGSTDHHLYALKL